MLHRKALGPILLAIVIGVCTACAHSDGGRTRAVISFDVFHDELATHGDWLWLQSYGWVWTPWNMDIMWRPYTHGHWLYTTSGWTWVSSWSWGWAPFHYGRWLWHPVHGWIWIPDRHWAPAWVAWRYTSGTIGWAPLPPSARWTPSKGLQWDGATTAVHPEAWSFVRELHILDRNLRSKIIRADESHHLLDRARDVTSYESNPIGIFARGVNIGELERSTGPIPAVPIFDLDRPPAAEQQRIQSDGVSFFRPSVDGARRATPSTFTKKRGKGRRQR